MNLKPKTYISRVDPMEIQRFVLSHEVSVEEGSICSSPLSRNSSRVVQTP